MIAMNASAKAQAQYDPFVGFAKQVEQELMLWYAPGISIAVVKDGKIILLDGYGKRDLDKNLPMKADTVQPIASVTKNIAVASLATLAET